MDDPEKKAKQNITPEPPEELLPPDPSEVPGEGDTKEEDFNFGGLPQRDLKKNLGCG